MAPRRARIDARLPRSKRCTAALSGAVSARSNLATGASAVNGNKPPGPYNTPIGGLDRLRHSPLPGCHLVPDPCPDAALESCRKLRTRGPLRGRSAPAHRASWSRDGSANGSVFRSLWLSTAPICSRQRRLNSVNDGLRRSWFRLCIPGGQGVTGSNPAVPTGSEGSSNLVMPHGSQEKSQSPREMAS